MKLRIKGNSIRIRLTKTEVSNFEQNGFYQEETNFGNAKLVYAIKRSSTHQQLSTDMLESCITLYIPETIANEWTSTDLVGFQNKYQHNACLLSSYVYQTNSHY